MAGYYQGVFRPTQPKKYKGDIKGIIYRSFLEFKAFRYLDTNPDVLEWSSEETIINYKSPIDNRMHRYFPDLKVKMKTKTVPKTYLIEIKPDSQTREPRVRMKGKGKPTKGYLYEVMEWGKNSAKWEAARRYCEVKDWEFILWTEKDLGVTYK